MLRYLLLPALLFTLAACTSDPDPADPDAAAPEAAVEMPDAPEDIVGAAEDLLGTWIVTSQGGMQPQTLYSVTFTRTGDYILRDEFQAERRRAFTPAGEGELLLAPSDAPASPTTDAGDAVAAEHLRDADRVLYTVSGDRLTLTTPGSDIETVLERRRDLLDSRPVLIPNVPVDPEPAQPPAQD